MTKISQPFATAPKHAPSTIPDNIHPSSATDNRAFPPEFVAESLGSSYQAHDTSGSKAVNVDDMDALLRGLSARERRDLSTALTTFSLAHPDALDTPRLLAETFAALGGMRLDDWPRMSTTLREALMAREYPAEQPKHKVLMALDPIEALILRMLRIQQKVGQNAMGQYMKALDSMVAAAKRRGDEILKDAQNNFNYAIAGAVVQGSLSIAGAGLGIRASYKNLRAYQAFNGSAPKGSWLRFTGKKSSSVAENKIDQASKGNECLLKERLESTAIGGKLGDALSHTAQPVGRLLQTGGELQGSTYKLKQNDASTDQNVFEALRNDEKDRVTKAIQSIASFQADFRAYIEKRASALDSTASARLA